MTLLSSGTQHPLLCPGCPLWRRSPCCRKGERAREQPRIPLRASSNVGHLHSHPGGWNIPSCMDLPSFRRGWVACALVRLRSSVSKRNGSQWTVSTLQWIHCERPPGGRRGTPRESSVSATLPWSLLPSLSVELMTHPLPLMCLNHSSATVLVMTICTVLGSGLNIYIYIHAG